MNLSTGKPTEELLARYLARQAGDAEIREVESWADESDANAAELNAWKKTWEVSGNLSQDKAFNSDQAWLKVKSRIKIDSPSLEAGAPVEEAKIRRLNSGFTPATWWAIAAGLVVLIGIFAVFSLSKDEDRFALLSKEVKSHQSPLEVLLPDSSVVILKPNSTLRYADPFPSGERLVALSGSGHFDVRKDASRPFSISTGTSFVKVLGTSFVVEAPSDGKSVTVSVESGKVLFSKEQVDGPSEDKSAVLLLPGDQGRLEEGRSAIVLDKSDPAEMRYLFDQTIIFTQTDLKTVCDMLGKLFKHDIGLGNSELGNCRLTATFKGQNLKEILQVIAGTFNLELTENSSTFVLNGTGCL